MYLQLLDAWFSANTTYNQTHVKGAEQIKNPATTTTVNLTVLILALEIAFVEWILGQVTKSVEPVLNVSGVVVEVPVVTVFPLFPFPAPVPPFLSPTMAISSNSGRCKKMYNLTHCRSYSHIYLLSYYIQYYLDFWLPNAFLNVIYWYAYTSSSW